MRRRLAIAVGAVGLVLVVLELAAVPLATRMLGAVVARCVAVDTFELTAVSRPIVPWLLLGRARDVELRATGIEAGDLRVAEASLRLPEAFLPWAVGDPPPARASLHLRVDEPGLEHALRSRLPVGVPVDVELQPGVATLGSDLLPTAVDLEAELEPDGTVRLRPVRGGDLLERLGLAASFPPGETARVRALDIGAGEVRGTIELDVVPGLGGDGCRTPLTAGTATSGTVSPRTAVAA